jgi:hypothetical protein
VKALGETAFRLPVVATPFATDTPAAGGPLTIVAPRLSLPDRLPGAPPMREIRLSREEKVIIIVAACVVGAILLVATIKIGANNGPF